MKYLNTHRIFPLHKRLFIMKKKFFRWFYELFTKMILDPIQSDLVHLNSAAVVCDS